MNARLLRDDERRPDWHFAVEEAVLRSVDSGESPETLRIRRSDPAVWIGLYQRPSEDVDIAAAESIGVPVMRRNNPGGAVYQDPGTLCYTCFFHKKPFFQRFGLSDVTELYALFGNAAIGALARFGVHAVLSPVNDVTIEGRKVYGSAQIEHYGTIAHSGTFLISCDIDRMDTLLRPSALKYAGRGISTVRDRVINLSEAVGRTVPVDELATALVQELKTATGFAFSEAGLLEHERRRAQELWSAKYGTRAWTYRDEPRSSHVRARRAASGVVILEASMDGALLSRVDIRGDFLVADAAALDRCIASLRGLTRAQAQDIVKAAPLPVDVAHAIVQVLQELP